MNVIIVHGKNTTPSEKWYPWLVNEFEKRNISVIVPVLPNSEDPEASVWLNEISKSNLNEESVLIGYSRGGVAILRWLEKLPEGSKVKKVILVAVNSGKSENMNLSKNNKGFYSKEGYDFDKIRSHCSDFVVIHSKDDHRVPFSAGEENAKGLNAKFKIYEDKRHFGKKESPTIPEVLEEI